MPPPEINYSTRAGARFAFRSVVPSGTGGLAFSCTVESWDGALTRVDSIDGGITVVSDTEIDVVFGSDVTREWLPRRYRYDVQVDLASGESETVQRGHLDVSRRVTDALSADYTAGVLDLLVSAPHLLTPDAQLATGPSVQPPELASATSFPTVVATPGTVTAQPPLTAAAVLTPAPLAAAGDLAFAPLVVEAPSFPVPAAAAGAVIGHAPLGAAAGSFPAPSATPGSVSAAAPLEQVAATFPAPSAAGGPVTVTAPKLTSAPDFPGHGIQPGAVTALPPLASDVVAFPLPSVVGGSASAAAPKLTETPTFPTPTASPGSVTVDPPRLLSTPSLPSPTATATRTANPPKLTVTPTFPAPAVGPAFPLKVNSGARYYEDQNGVPFRLQSLAMWTMSTGATTADMQDAIGRAAAKGFNALILMGVVQDYADAHFSWSQTDRNGNDPFSPAGQFDHPVDAYWDHIALIIQTAASYGMAVQLFPMYLGYNGGAQGWWSDVNDSHNTITRCFNFGVYLGNKLGSYANLIWMMGGDYLMPADASTPSGEGRTRVHKILEGIRSVSPTQIAGNEWQSPDFTGSDSHSPDQAGFTYGTSPGTSDIQGDWMYAFGPSNSGHTFTTADASWDGSPTLPGIAEETMWKGGAYAPVPSAREDVRAQQHWAITSGAVAGTTWGIVGISSWEDANWSAAFSDAAMADQQRAFALYGSLSWQKHVPSGKSGISSRTLVVSGGGSGDSKITSSMASDGSSLLAYVPTTGTGTTTFSVDLRGLASGTMLAQWWNPTTGARTTIGGMFNNTLSSKSVTTPGNNGTGTNDWMLVITVS